LPFRFVFSEAANAKQLLVCSAFRVVCDKSAASQFHLVQELPGLIFQHQILLHMPMLSAVMVGCAIEALAFASAGLLSPVLHVKEVRNHKPCCLIPLQLWQTIMQFDVQMIALGMAVV
jgi:hypothetical protein